MQKQTPKWLELFITAFGAKGLVALAWWMGALNAERIRGMHKSYPFLEVTGSAGTGKSTLLRVLWRLIGSDESETINALFGVNPSLLSKMNKGTVDWPVVLDDTAEAEPFDWEVIKACYTGDSTLNRGNSSAHDELRFKGALTIIGNTNTSGSINSRMVVVKLERALHCKESEQAIAALLAMPINETASFLTTASLFRERIVERLGTATTAITDALHEDTGGNLSHRDALNHAQLRALLMALDDLFHLPPEISQAAHAEVHSMTWESAVPY